MIFFAAFLLLLFGSFGLSWWKGGSPERIVASVFLTAWLVSVALYAADAGRYLKTDWVSLALNIAMALALFAVAQFANRSWPMITTSLQVLIVLAQIGKRLRPEWMWQVYMIMNTIWPYLQLTVLLIGIVFHWRREVALGPEPSWRTSSRPTHPHPGSQTI